MMTLRILSPQMAFSARISFSTRSYFPSRSQPMLMTMSISTAPLAMASLVSNSLTAVVTFPLGKPMTVHTAILSPRYSLACFT